MESQKLPIYLTKRQTELLIMAEYLDSVGFFGTPLTQSRIDWDREGNMGNVFVGTNYKPPMTMGLDKIL